ALLQRLRRQPLRRRPAAALGVRPQPGRSRGARQRGTAGAPRPAVPRRRHRPPRPAGQGAGVLLLRALTTGLAIQSPPLQGEGWVGMGFLTAAATQIPGINRPPPPRSPPSAS